MTMTTIDRFDGTEYRWLSNFWVSPMIVDGKEYGSNEHYYQACKSATEADHEQIRLAATPGLTKKMGKVIDLRPDWEEVKEAVMLTGLRAKFAVGSDLAAKLMATGNAKLIEGNNWSDTYWGVCQGTGKNRLGILLMQVRQELVLKS